MQANLRRSDKSWCCSSRMCGVCCRMLLAFALFATFQYEIFPHDFFFSFINFLLFYRDGFPFFRFGFFSFFWFLFLISIKFMPHCWIEIQKEKPSFHFFTFILRYESMLTQINKFVLYFLAFLVQLRWILRKSRLNIFKVVFSHFCKMNAFCRFLFFNFGTFHTTQMHTLIYI